MVSSMLNSRVSGQLSNAAISEGLGPVRLVAEYREEASRCREMASKENNPKTRTIILKLACEFEELAYRREQALKSATKQAG